jgi:hypothetical protein
MLNTLAQYFLLFYGSQILPQRLPWASSLPSKAVPHSIRTVTPYPNALDVSSKETGHE